MMRDFYTMDHEKNVEFKIKQEFARVDVDGSGQITIDGLSFYQLFVCLIQELNYIFVFQRNGSYLRDAHGVKQCAYYGQLNPVCNYHCTLIYQTGLGLTVIRCYLYNVQIKFFLLNCKTLN